jgi:hypothetical protein
MNVEIGAEAAQFPEKEYINGIAVAVHVAWRQSYTRVDYIPQSGTKNLASGQKGLEDNKLMTDSQPYA